MGHCFCSKYRIRICFSWNIMTGEEGGGCPGWLKKKNLPRVISEIPGLPWPSPEQYVKSTGTVGSWEKARAFQMAQYIYHPKCDNIEVTVHLAGLFFPTPAELIVSDHPPFSVGLTKSWVPPYSDLPMMLLGHWTQGAVYWYVGTWCAFRSS